MNSQLAIACVDVGKNVGWALLTETGPVLGSTLEPLIERLVAALRCGKPVALGFECPLYFPRRPGPDAPLRARAGEGNRAWATGAGAAALVAGLGQLDAVLTGIARDARGVVGTTRWADFSAGLSSLFLWEAFITGTQGPVVPIPTAFVRSATADQQDALTGALAFAGRIRTGEPSSDLGREPVRSLAALQLLANGLSTDVSLLGEPCLVIKARKAK